ncbi:hypothetical protein O1Q96_37540 [Streptomyces sp. Qhu-G9]|uniref:hypothetical protein n=1 Tax=Streptomyces sp. Qhu-G9 TaxID=3452799 RepID=UPI0022ABE2FD|nr:hypothetical protein [Streptomyces aurantiacus]WAU84898.1 hypothetical protein O1Q96_37540 [Streptomyces aurantiacus]
MLSPKQVAYWEARLAATATNKDRARALWDLARTLAGDDEARWADLVRMLQAWTQAHTS